MKLAVPGGPHLTYCTNIHPGETWDEVRANLERHVRRVKAAVAPDRPFGVGLRLSAQAAETLARPAELEEFRGFLRDSGFYVFTINGFPYGPFHGTRVKEEVYLPDWLDDARLQYSDRLAELLAALLPEEPGLEGTVSTVPGAYKGRVRGAADASRMAELMIRHAAGLHRLWERTGKLVSLALEPEPCCHMETVDETVRFFEAQLFRGAGRDRVRPARRPAAAASARPPCGATWACASTPVTWRSSSRTRRRGSRRCAGAGIRVGKVQVSAGLRVALDPGNRALLDALRPFAEGVYLHQVVERRDGRLTRYLDLPEALEAVARDGGGPREWRIHFHVPLFREELGRFASTQDYLRGVLAPAAARGAHAAPRGRDVHLGRPPRGIPPRGHRLRRRPRAPLGPRPARGQALTS